MKKLFSTIAFFLLVITGKAQSGLPQENNLISRSTVVPSPEAFSFTRYGDVPVGLFTGTMTYSIPLFQIQSGKILIPISLDYASNGVKVDGVSGRTGMDWNLKIGGIITRNIMGRADETIALVAPSSSDSLSWDFYNYVKAVGDGNSNTQPDEFTYNFMGKTGKFYFDYSGNVREFSPSGFKIATNTGFQYFQITIPDGTIYFFNTDEETYNYSVFSDNNDPNVTYGGTTAWYLTKVKNIYGDSIVYQYSGIGAVEYISEVNQTQRIVNPLAWDAIIEGPYLLSSSCGPLGQLGEGTWGSPDHDAVGTTTDIRRTVSSGVKLTDVIFKQGRLKLYYSSRDDLPGELKLDNIEMFSKFDINPISSIGFDYEYSQSNSIYNTPVNHYPNGSTDLQVTYPYLSKRLFLEKVKFFNSGKTIFNFYKFDYDSLNKLPPRLSFSQDIFGYANGKVSASFLPRSTMFNQLSGNRSQSSSRVINPDFNKKGLLTKITYPTGGHSSILYESSIIETYIDSKEKFDTIRASINYDHSSWLEYSPPFKIYDIPFSLKLSAEWVTPPDPNGPQDDSAVSVSIVDSATNSCVLFCSSNVMPGHSYEFYVPNNFVPDSRSYKIKLETGNSNVKAKAEFIYYKNVPDTLHSYPISGPRVATIKSYTSDEDLVGYKKFIYAGPNGNASGSPIIDFKDRRDFVYIERKMKDAGGGNWYNAANYVLSSNGIIGRYDNDYAAINYEYVTEIFDSLGIGGSIQTQFLLGKTTIAATIGCAVPYYVSDFSPFLIPGAPHSNTGYLNGKEFRKTFYRNVSGASKKVKEITNYYSTDSRLYNVDRFFVIRKARSRNSYLLDWKYFSDYDINKYQRISAWVHLDSTIQKDYDASDREIGLKSIYSYGNMSHLMPTEIKTITSTHDILKVVKKYTDDLRQLNPGNTILSSMQQNNIINIPLKSETYLNSVLLKTSLLTFNSALLPALLETSTKNTPLEIDEQYTKYDNLGNLREYKIRGQLNAIFVDTALGSIISSCKNAAFDDVAYTSFETGFTGNWSGISPSYVVIGNPGVTGEKYYNQTSFNISKPSLNSSVSYIVSYWSKNNSYNISGTQTGYPKVVNSKVVNSQNWTCYEHLVSGQNTITITGNGAIDELRLYPNGAQMTSYTYRSLFGITTQCDVNNRIIYYSYDGFGRLSIISDQQGNIIKKYCYNVYGQVEDCQSFTYSNVTKQGIFLRNNCTTGRVGSTVTYTVAAGTYSSTISQADADINAQNDIDANGQVYANSNGFCVSACNPSNCYGDDKKCINDNCETGIRINTSSTYNPSTGRWDCVYHYEFSDGNWSQNYVEDSFYECMF